MAQFLNQDGANISQLNQEIGQLQLQQAQLQQVQVPHQPSAFRRILGGVAGVAGNMFAPGLGGALGGFIGGSGGSGSLLGAGTLGSLFGGQGAAAATQLAAVGQATNAANFAAAQQVFQLTQQADVDQETIELASDLEKSRHSTIMSVIQNIGS